MDRDRGRQREHSGWHFRITNLNGETVRIFFDIPLDLIPLPGNTLEILVELPNNVVRRYEVLTEHIGTDLAVGDPRTRGQGGRGSGGGPGSSGGERRDDGAGTPSNAPANQPPRRTCGISNAGGGVTRRTCR